MINWLLAWLFPVRLPKLTPIEQAEVLGNYYASQIFLPQAGPGNKGSDFRTHAT
jgi:hypothetical protein